MAIGHTVGADDRFQHFGRRGVAGSEFAQAEQQHEQRKPARVGGSSIHSS
jgi:hypothetical protein